jgi:hypothetical protein
MGCQQKKLPKILQPKKGKRRCEAAFFNNTSNYCSLLNLNNIMKNNQYYEDTKSSKTRDFKL